MLAFWAIVLVENALRKSIQFETRDQQARELELKLEQARLHSLHTQIRPHFMFNTLNAVSSLTLRGDREQASEVVVAVADLLRTSLDRSKSAMVTVGDELAFVDQYVTIVKQRFHDRFELSRTVAPDTLEILIPSFMLQNLVENTIKHAVENSEQPISLTLDIARTDSSLRITAANNLPEQTVAYDRDEGYGLRSIRERLDAHFGDRGRLEIDSRAPDKFTVRIKLPVTTDTNASHP